MNKLFFILLPCALFMACSPSNTNNTQEGLPEGAVDLGLSVYWGTCNIGASNASDRGDYYAWGVTETWSKNYKWQGEDWNKVTKYCPEDKTNYWAGTGSPDNKIVLDLEDDTAHVVLGGKWRIPTVEEWRELMTKCTYSAGSFTGPNGNSIFLPRAGGSFEIDAHRGYYWSSTLNIDTPFQALIMMMEIPGYGDPIHEAVCARGNGISIRPVMSK